MFWKIYPSLKGKLAAPFLFSAKLRHGKDKSDHCQKANCMFSLQDSTLNAPQKTLSYTHSLSITGDGLAKTTSITLLLQCAHWLITVKSLDALGSNWLLYRGRMPLLPVFLWLLLSITASGKCNLPSRLSSTRLMGFSPADSFGIIFNNLILLMLLSDYFSQSKYSLRRWRIIWLVCFPVKTCYHFFLGFFVTVALEQMVCERDNPYARKDN